MRIHEITQTLNEAGIDTVKAYLDPAGLAAKAKNWLIGPRYTRDPATGRLVPGKTYQAAIDYNVNINVSKLANEAVKKFYEYVQQTYKDREPTVTEFKDILEQWAKSYLPPSTWNWSDYSVIKQNELNSEMASLVGQYQSAPAGQKLKQIQNQLYKFVVFWMAKTREQEKEKSSSKSVDLGKLGRSFASQFSLLSPATGVRASKNIYSTSNNDIDDFLSNMRFIVSATRAPSIPSRDPAAENAIKSNTVFQRWQTTLASSLPHVMITSTGDPVVDEFFRALGYTIT